MIYLIITIITNAMLFLLFRWFSQKQFPVFQVIVWNYVVCAITGFLYEYKELPSEIYIYHIDTVLWASVTGCAFLPSFFMIGTSTTLAGVTPTSMANKLSMVIPVLFALATGLAIFSWIKAAAILLGIASVILITVKKEEEPAGNKPWHRFLPLIVFLSGGLLDLALMYLNKHVITPETTGLFTMHVFIAAAGCGLVSLTILTLIQKNFLWKGILGGIMLGIPNYFSVYFLLKALSHYNHDGSFVYPVLNLSIILFSAVSSFLLFRDKPSLRMLIGLGIATSSITLLYFASR